MHHPFERWPGTGRRGVLAALVVFFLLASVLIGWAGSRLRHDDAPAGMVSLQLAGSEADVVKIVTPWAEEGDLHIAGFALGVDMAYLLAYGLLGSALAAGIALRARARGRGAVAAWAALVGWLFWVGAGLDVVENVLHLPLLDEPTSGSPAAVTGVALAKWTFIGPALLSLPATALLTLRSRRA